MVISFFFFSRIWIWDKRERSGFDQVLIICSIYFSLSSYRFYVFLFLLHFDNCVLFKQLPKGLVPLFIPKTFKYHVPYYETYMIYNKENNIKFNPFLTYFTVDSNNMLHSVQ